MKMRGPSIAFNIAFAIVALVMLARGPTTWAFNAGEGISGTPHDFTALTNNTEAIGECTFCHTPHKAATTELLWNHKLSNNTFTWDINTTTAGTEYPSISGDTYKGPTAKCLSCHDGTVALGDVAWFNEGGPKVLNPDKIADAAHLIATTAGDMSGNHPVAMPYPYLNFANTYNGKTTGSAATLTEWQATPVSPVRLYNDSGGGDISGGPVATRSGIECSSCHDPHNKKAVGDLFLLGDLTGNTTSYICLKCHVK